MVKIALRSIMEHLTNAFIDAALASHGAMSKDVIDHAVTLNNSYSWGSYRLCWADTFFKFLGHGGVQQVLNQEKYQTFVNGLYRVNQAGRVGYLRDDHTNTEKGIKVLASVQDDLDCLFIHLRENSAICKAAKV